MKIPPILFLFNSFWKGHKEAGFFDFTSFSLFFWQTRRDWSWLFFFGNAAERRNRMAVRGLDWLDATAGIESRELNGSKSLFYFIFQVSILFFLFFASLLPSFILLLLLLLLLLRLRLFFLFFNVQSHHVDGFNWRRPAGRWFDQLQWSILFKKIKHWIDEFLTLKVALASRANRGAKK